MPAGHPWRYVSIFPSMYQKLPRECLTHSLSRSNETSQFGPNQRGYNYQSTMICPLVAFILPHRVVRILILQLISYFIILIIQ